MRIKETTVYKTIKVNLGNFSNAEIHHSITATIDEGDDIQEVTKTLTEMVNEQVYGELNEVLELKIG